MDQRCGTCRYWDAPNANNEDWDDGMGYSTCFMFSPDPMVDRVTGSPYEAHDERAYVFPFAGADEGGWQTRSDFGCIAYAERPAEIASR